MGAVQSCHPVISGWLFLRAYNDYFRLRQTAKTRHLVIDSDKTQTGGRERESHQSTGERLESLA